eukprot:362280-Chlamydomonas_euryale.AAC.1
MVVHGTACSDDACLNALLVVHGTACSDNAWSAPLLTHTAPSLNLTEWFLPHVHSDTPAYIHTFTHAGTSATLIAPAASSTPHTFTHSHMLPAWTTSNLTSMHTWQR